MSPKIEISLELLNAILNYLGTKPFTEVAGFVNAVKEEARNQMPPQVPPQEEPPAED